MSFGQRPSGGDGTQRRALLSDPQFLSLWLSQGVAQTAQNAMLFALLVVVLQLTGSSVHTSILIFCFILPSIPLGFIVGVVLDRINKARVLVLTSALRAAACVLFFFFHGDVWVIYGIALSLATAGLFFNPAVVSLIPAIVPKERLVPANSLYNFTLTGSQLVGIVFVAPILLQALGPDGMFLAAAVMFSAAGVFGARVHVRDAPAEPRSPEGSNFSTMPTEFRESWRVLTSDRYSVLALGQLIVSASLVLVFAMLIPRYMRDVLDVPAENAALVFAPVGIGALVGLRFLPWVAKKGKNRAVVIGLIGIAACMVLLALVEPLARITEATPGTQNIVRLLRISLLQALTMLFAGPMGFFYAMINAPAQTVLHERAPPDMRGRIFATQVVSANFMSLLPLLAIGAITDLLNITLVLLLLAVLVSVMAVASAQWGAPESKLEGESRREREKVST